MIPPISSALSENLVPNFLPRKTPVIQKPKVIIAIIKEATRALATPY